MAILHYGNTATLKYGDFAIQQIWYGKFAYSSFTPIYMESLKAVENDWLHHYKRSTKKSLDLGQQPFDAQNDLINWIDSCT